MAISSKRAEYLARASFAVSVIFFVVTILIGLWSDFFTIFAASWLMPGSALIWFVLCLWFHQRGLAEQEKLDATRMAKDKESSTIFQEGHERSGIFAIAQRRLAVFEKWFIPIFSGAIAAYQIGIGIYLWKSIRGVGDETNDPLLCAVLMAAMAFVSFLLSRYATGMSFESQWKPLKAGGSYLFCAAILYFVLAVALALVQFRFYGVIDVVSRVIPVVLVVLGAETAINIVLDIYRPRLKDQYHRSPLDSRLLGLINEPGGIFRTAASAIDYQFGFNVSQTWFYKLLERAIAPLVLFAGLTLYLLSCFVTVGPNEEAIIEHFGSVHKSSNEVRLVGPGLAFKWPWPIDKAYKYPTKRISEIHVGYEQGHGDGHGHGDEPGGLEPLLWGMEHFEEEYMVLVAGESESSNSETVPVSLLIAEIPVQYRVKDLYSFMYNHKVIRRRGRAPIYEAEDRLKSICYSELTKFAASATIEVGGNATDESLLGAGRAKAKETLTQRIQAAADEAQLGIEIVFLGLQGVHPPTEVAEGYQNVIGAVQKKQAAILRAQAARNETLSSLAGSVSDFEKFYALASAYLEAKEQNDTDQIEKIGGELDVAFATASGEIFEKLRVAQSYAFEKMNVARGTGERFAGQIKAYNAAPEFYKREQRLVALEEALDEIRKYVVVGKDNDKQITVIDLQKKLTPSIYDLEGVKEK
jgi:regulator of protease activity HflC (stomatin/prohibitin superfamily)